MVIEEKKIDVQESEIKRKDGIMEINISLKKIETAFKAPKISLCMQYKGNNERTFALELNKKIGNNHFTVELLISKPIIHRHLNIAYKTLKVIDNMNLQSEAGKEMIWDWGIYEDSKIDFSRIPKLDNIEHLVYNILTKSPIIIYGDSFETVFSTFFMLVSPINNPAYNDYNWAFNPEISPKLNEFSALNVVDPSGDGSFVLVEKIKERLKREPAIIDLINNTVSTGRKSSLVRELSNAISEGGMEKISNAVGKIFGLMKEWSRSEDIGKFKEINNLSDADMLLLEEIAYAVQK